MKTSIYEWTASTQVSGDGQRDVLRGAGAEVPGHRVEAVVAPHEADGDEEAAAEAGAGAALGQLHGHYQLTGGPQQPRHHHAVLPEYKVTRELNNLF